MTTYRDHQNAIIDHFWEGFYARHANDPSVYGTWSDKDTIKERFAVDFKVLFNQSATLTPEELNQLIKNNRAGRKAAGFATE